jgi:hypothetical protein
MQLNRLECTVTERRLHLAVWAFRIRDKFVQLRLRKYEAKAPGGDLYVSKMDLVSLFNINGWYYNLRIYIPNVADIT